jgi:hypothetical protein
MKQMCLVCLVAEEHRAGSLMEHRAPPPTCAAGRRASCCAEEVGGSRLPGLGSMHGGLAAPHRFFLNMARFALHVSSCNVALV